MKDRKCCGTCGHCTYIHEYEIYFCSELKWPITTPYAISCDSYVYDDEDGETDS